MGADGHHPKPSAKKRKQQSPRAGKLAARIGDRQGRSASQLDLRRAQLRRETIVSFEGGQHRLDCIDRQQRLRIDEDQLVLESDRQRGRGRERSLERVRQPTAAFDARGFQAAAATEDAHHPRRPGCRRAPSAPPKGLPGAAACCAIPDLRQRLREDVRHRPRTCAPNTPLYPTGTLSKRCT
jgi:hypothetical protein